MINDLIQLFGIANPQLSIAWTFLGKTAAATAVTNPSTLALNCTGGGDEWVAPVAGIINVNNGLEKIVLPNGGTPPSGVVIHVDPQVHLKLTRLYAASIEGMAANTDKPERPVPYYFVYTNITTLAWTDNGTQKNGPDAGLVYPGDRLHLTGDLTIHDQHGFPIDPIAVAASFDAMMIQHVTLESKAINKGSGALTANRQLTTIGNMGAAGTTMQLLTLNGAVYNPASLSFQNITAVDAACGYYTVTNTVNPINKIAGASTDLKISAATFGTLADAYTIRALRAGLNLHRDFIRAYVTDLKTYLLGNAPATEPSIANGSAPVYRDNELINFCANGNECFGYINGMLGGAPPLPLLASPVIDNDFNLPPLPTAAGAHLWPNFPPPLPAGPFAPIPANFKQNIVFNAAHFITDAATSNADVYVEIACPQFTNGDSIRIYNRIFDDSDASEKRGDGAGAIVAGNKAAFRLTDPFGLVKPFSPVIIPSLPTLSLDLVIVNRGLQRRTVGNLFTPVAAQSALSAAETAALAIVLNIFNNIPERGTSPSGILGMSAATPLPGAVNFGQFVLNMLNENQPRQAGRLPTMARKDSMAAAFIAGNWQGFVGGTVAKKDALNNYPIFGNPGNPGGKEYSSAGIQTQGGLLAYDIARAAYRRTRNVMERMSAFVLGANVAAWAYMDTPPAPVANSSFAAASLQTIAAGCETPEIAGLLPDMTTFPATFAAFLQAVQTASGLGTLPPWVPAALVAKYNAAIVNLGNDVNSNRAYNELRREATSSIYGRRDTYWALLNAIQNAKECIYIQGTFFGSTAYGANQPADLLAALTAAIAQNKRLKVILCLSKPIHFGKGYETFEARFYKKRKDAIDTLMGAIAGNPPAPANASQVIAFHPKGFPMRPKELIHQAVIVDDVWALVGSSSFSRRGMMFDGSQDVSLVDKKIIGGKSAGVKKFRLQLMQEHLNITPAAGLPGADAVRINNLHESFYVFKELLEAGGAGLIEPIWAGDRTNITDASFPSDDLADPDNNSFSPANASLIAALNMLGTTPA